MIIGENHQPTYTEFINLGASAELAECLCIMANQLHEKKIIVLITSIYRSNKKQQEYYEQGRSKPGRIITQAKPGTSAHNREENGKPASDAVDVAPIIDGKASWKTDGEGKSIWYTINDAAQIAGLRWGHDTYGMTYDWCHFYYDRKNQPQPRTTS